jgi:hypothetical protein
VDRVDHLAPRLAERDLQATHSRVAPSRAPARPRATQPPR